MIVIASVKSREGAGSGKWKKEEKAMEELDKELVSYLASDAPAATSEVAPVASVDVEMPKRLSRTSFFDF